MSESEVVVHRDRRGAREAHILVDVFASRPAHATRIGRLCRVIAQMAFDLHQPLVLPGQRLLQREQGCVERIQPLAALRDSLLHLLLDLLLHALLQRLVLPFVVQMVR